MTMMHLISFARCLELSLLVLTHQDQDKGNTTTETKNRKIIFKTKNKIVKILSSNCL